MNYYHIKHFILGFFSIFKISRIHLRKKHTVDIVEYFIRIEQNINSAFRELKSEHERN
jgi:hypothetical protein